MKLSFQSKLESISSESEYYAFSVPEKISRALKTKAAVPILAKVNDSPTFRGSLFPVGGGRHYMRVKAEIRKAAKIKEGDRARVQIEVVDRAKEASNLPKDLVSALRSEGVLKEFKELPPGKKGFMLRLIEKAAKSETREKRIQDAVEAAYMNRER